MPTVVGENILEVFLAVPMVVGENILEFFDFGSYRARMQRRGHGCSAEGTWAGRTREPAGLGRRKQKNQIASRFDFFIYIIFLTWYGVI